MGNKKKSRTAREIRRMPAPPDPSKAKLLNSTSNLENVEEEKIDLHSKPVENKDFLHEVNKIAGNMVTGLILTTSSDCDKICVVDPTNRTVPRMYKEKKFRYGKGTLCTTSEYGGVIMVSHATKTQIA